MARISLCDADGFGAVSTAEHRDLPVFAPPGIQSCPTEGDRALLIPAGGKNICAGVLSNAREIAAGELRLFSAGGASITLKNNGDIELNGITITKNGELILPRQQEES